MANMVLGSFGKSDCDFERNGTFPDRVNQVGTGRRAAVVFWAERNRTVSLYFRAGS